MRKFSVVILALALCTGCAHKVNPLPQGAISQNDASSFRVLADAHAFLQSIRDSVTAGKLTLTPNQKAAFNDVVASYNAAEATWQLCHTGACTAQQQNNLNTQVGQLNNKLVSAQSVITVTP